MEVRNIKIFFESIQVYLSEEWLESCIHWCKAENLPPNYTQKELQSLVYEQWLLLDLRDVEVPSLPPNLSSKKHFTLNGIFCLQMMQVVDISKPKLWQLQRIRNINILTRGTQQDVDIVGTGKRMLQLTLTDGVQEVEAMEYHPISSLNINLPPGVKIRIIGPITIRRGKLLLEQQNVKVLGGEVEELLIPNAAENVLAKALNLPQNPNPFTIQETVLHVENEDKTEGFVSNIKPINAQSIHNSSNIGKSNTATTNIKPVSAQPTYSSSNANKSSVVVTKIQHNKKSSTRADIIPIDDEEEELEKKVAEEVQFLLEAEEELGQNDIDKSATPDLFEENDFNVDDFDVDKISGSSTQVCHPRPKIIQKVQDLSTSLDGDDDVFDNMDIDAHLDQIHKEKQDVPILKINIVTIARLLENKNNINGGIFKIKAKFKSVIEKLTIGDDEYKITIQVEDISGDLIARLHSDIVAEFAGYSPTAILSLKSSILDKNDEAVGKVMKAIQKVKDQLLELDHIMDVKISKDETPVILKIYQK